MESRSRKSTALTAHCAIRRAVNLRGAPHRYLIDPRDHFAAIRTARAGGLDVVGAYHSHPDSSPVPSQIDLREADDPQFLHIIVSPAAGGCRAYLLTDRNFLEVEIVTVP